MLKETWCCFIFTIEVFGFVFLNESFFFSKEPNSGRWGNHCWSCRELGGGELGGGREAGSQGAEFPTGVPPGGVGPGTCLPCGWESRSGADVVYSLTSYFLVHSHQRSGLVARLAPQVLADCDKGEGATQFLLWLGGGRWHTNRGGQLCPCLPAPTNK